MLLLNTMKRYPLLEKIKYDVITNEEVIHSVFLQINKKQKQKCFQNVFNEKSLKLSWKFIDRPKFPVRSRLKLVLLPILAMKGALQLDIRNL